MDFRKTSRFFYCLAPSARSRIIQGIIYQADQLTGNISCPLIAFLLSSVTGSVTGARLLLDKNTFLGKAARGVPPQLRISTLLQKIKV
jgi:hypothetical protein